MYFCPNTLTLFLACHSTARVGEMLIFETTNNKEEEEEDGGSFSGVSNLEHLVNIQSNTRAMGQYYR